ncbi:phenylalanine--tRNA ligase, mitochondrial-like [Hydractinia symbiolongicarpus]|uniref:phenylalanine--tRNA ligase, mitochondrial-like n=1 Tax=Hydractinia symbiolongicarpus TaxID=13093 RepID=UPI00254FFE83|nr:phenylalanine--tRNA ligase, mitochondrial-like [Hydractinia symbiolongicarpus]
MNVFKNYYRAPQTLLKLPRQLCFCVHYSQASTNHYNVQQLELLGRKYQKDEMTNIGENIVNKLGRKLHLLKDHPLEIIKRKIRDHFHANYRSRFGGCVFASIDNLNPIVNIKQNFDSLLVPKDHVSRAKNDNYYVNKDYVLRSHTTAHEVELLKSGWNAFLNCGDCYRRDEIDSSHYPVFHQMEGVRLFDQHELFLGTKDDTLKILESHNMERTSQKQGWYTSDATAVTEYNLKYTLMQLAEYLFGDDIEMRWVDAYFPFTHPSWELEIKLNGEWMEMLGCGILEHGIMQNAGAGDRIGWAFGLGLERFAMKLFHIPDIRLFWSTDPRFLSQFEGKENAVFKPFSKYPPSYKDISFWLNEDFAANDLFEIVRSVAGDVVEEMTLVDQFIHPKTRKSSVCYRITYRAMDRTLRDEEVNELQDEIRNSVERTLNVSLR